MANDNFKKKHVIFDFDGTIANTKDEVAIIYNKLANQFKIKKVTPNFIDHLSKKTALEILKELDISIHKLPLLLINVRKKLKDRIPYIKTCDGMDEVLSKLYDKQIKMYIISSNSEENIRLFINNNNISFFNYIYSASSAFGKHKTINKLIKKIRYRPQGNSIYRG